MPAPLIDVNWEGLAIALVKYGAAVAVVWKGSKEVAKTIKNVFASGIDTHVKPLFENLGQSLDGLASSVGSLKTDHQRVVARVDGHDETLGELGERVAKVEGRLE